MCVADIICYPAPLHSLIPQYLLYVYYVLCIVIILYAGNRVMKEKKKRLGLGPHGTFNLGEEINIKLIVTQNIVKLQL